MTYQQKARFPVDKRSNFNKNIFELLNLNENEEYKEEREIFRT